MIKPGSGILFMKVGTHAQETLDEIIARKAREIDEAGFGMWGYGGNTCHPRTMVQPFAEYFARGGRPIVLCMEPMVSNHFADPLRANEYSVDGIEWKEVPREINVLGSRFALVIKNLRKENETLSLSQTRVAIGPCKGRNGVRYVQGRVDKACLEVLEKPELLNEPSQKDVNIGLAAELIEPYAVFLR